MDDYQKEKIEKTDGVSRQVDTKVRQHDRNKHYFCCSNCGYIGLESELYDDPNHECGKDQCPECQQENYITCCYLTYEDAENRENSIA